MTLDGGGNDDGTRSTRVEHDAARCGGFVGVCSLSHAELDVAVIGLPVPVTLLYFT